MDEQTRVSVVIPTYNRYDQVVRAISVLVGQVLTCELAGSVEVLVVDDGSPPAVAGRVRDHIAAQGHRFLRYLGLPMNRGASAAYNAGAEASRGELVAFLDDDIVPAADYVIAMIAAHQRHPDALVINGNLLPLRDDLYSRFWFYYYDAVFNKPGATFYEVKMLASGHCSMKRAVLGLESPLFDTSLTSREDYDLYLRLEKRGIPVYKDDSIIAFNDCRATLYGFLRQRLWYGRGQAQLVAKHGAALLAAKQRDYEVPPNPEYLYLYFALRVARRAVRLYARARRLFEHERG